MASFKHILFLLASVVALSASAQNLREKFRENPDMAGGVYYVYTFDDPETTSPPEGYRPVYISHYGRHGSRWLLSDEEYEQVFRVFDGAADRSVLTPFGEEIHRRVREVYEDGIHRAGDLSPLGVRQHRGIAERMFRSYPELLSDDAAIEAQATVVVRCVLSMAAFCERLKELNPKLRITRTAGNRTTYYLNFFNKLPWNDIAPEYLDFMKQGPWRKESEEWLWSRISEKRLVDTLFVDSEYRRKLDGRKLMLGLFGMARGMQNVESDISLYDLFSPDEIYAMSVYDNYEYYVTRGPSRLNRGYPQHYAKALLRDMLERADCALSGDGPVADLRFGHDGNIMAFVPLLHFAGWDAVCSDPEEIAEKWPVFRLSPMAANIQFVFYRHERTENILVKMLLNETEVRIPIESISGPYYRWSDVRAYYDSLLNAGL